jgi:hypothetical protein
MEAGGLAALVAGVILVGRSPALSGLSHLRHGEEDPPEPADEEPKDPPGGAAANARKRQFLSPRLKPRQPQRDTPG